jgi:hypothetical protein
MTLIAHALVAVGIIALSVSPALAGGGQGGGSDVLGLQCHLINGVNQPHVVNTTDNAFEPTSIRLPDRENVRIGNGRLVCAPVNITVPEGFIPLDDTSGYPGDNQEFFKCYDALDPRLIFSRGTPVTTWDAVDVEDLRVGAPVFICLPARVTAPMPHPTPAP